MCVASKRVVWCIGNQNATKQARGKCFKQTRTGGREAFIDYLIMYAQHTILFVQLEEETSKYRNALCIQRSISIFRRQVFPIHLFFGSTVSYIDCFLLRIFCPEFAP